MRKVTVSVIALGILLLCSAPATANTVTVTGSMTVGAQSFAMSFDWDVTANSMVLGSDHMDAQGPLGAFTLSSVLPPNPSLPGLPFINWRDAAGDWFQLDDENTGGPRFGKFPTLGAYGANNLDLWCFTGREGACYDLGHSGAYFGGVFGNPASLVVSAPVPTPETGTALLLLCGLAVLAIASVLSVSTTCNS